MAERFSPLIQEPLRSWAATARDAVARGAAAVGNPPNPKQVYGEKKVPLHLVPSAGVIHEAVAFKDGAEKYGHFNWRVTKVEALTYIGAALRHILSYVDGEEIDPQSANGAHHLGLARACLGIILDAKACETLIDNRPPSGAAGTLLRQSAER